jgi:chemotaxis protein methyltransferase CheR
MQSDHPARNSWTRVAEGALGIRMGLWPDKTLERVFVEVAAAAGLKGPEQVARRLAARHLPTRHAVLSGLSLGETYVLRHPRQFEAVRHLLRRAEGQVTLWSAGCSTGEEAWSLALVAFEVLGPAAQRRVRVLGTDINQSSLQAAERGVYRPWALRALDGRTRDAWFVPAGTLWEVRRELRAITRFLPLDLLEGAASLPHEADLCMLRNVLLYLTAPARRTAVAAVARSLRQGGTLLLSPTDPKPLDSPLVEVQESWGSTLHKNTDGRTEPAALPAPVALPPELPAPELIPEPAPEPERGEVIVLTRARELLGDGHWAAALAEVDRLLLRSPRHAAALTLRACSLARVGRMSEAALSASLALWQLASEPLPGSVEMSAAELHFLCQYVLDLARSPHG